ncbi:hypothetical protein NQ315_004502 [Exocentrus adspersus]|uniref:Uncharacterized protein n=1 Tax=Exocentrus adspersus TaxID=1586481 RepID=A0AAV8VQ24_9CUCU|nr:hypothetical protein NQ315_004502 [Exocentrus adspersus]
MVFIFFYWAPIGIHLRTPVLLNNSPIIRLSNIHEQCQDYIVLAQEIKGENEVLTYKRLILLLKRKHLNINNEELVFDYINNLI